MLGAVTKFETPNWLGAPTRNAANELKNSLVGVRVVLAVFCRLAPGPKKAVPADPNIGVKNPSTRLRRTSRPTFRSWMDLRRLPVTAALKSLSTPDDGVPTGVPIAAMPGILTEKSCPLNPLNAVVRPPLVRSEAEFRLLV